jgi:hypothetical protein
MEVGMDKTDPIVVVIARALDEVGFEVRNFKTCLDVIGQTKKSGGMGGISNIMYNLDVAPKGD